MAARGLFINSTEQGFTVRGINNNFFPDNATLAYPANSVILITDDSDMATFRSASNYDVLFSALIKDININGEQVTKDSIIETFNEAANKPMSNPDSFTSVEYDGKNDLIFYNDKGEEVAKVDVTPFIKDGMIEDVEISEGNLVIHFNTDSEIKDIYIPLTEIFDPNQYYTKEQIDAKEQSVNASIALKANITDLNAETTARQDADTTLQNGLDSLALNLANEISNRQDADTTLQSNIDTKANIEDVYDKQTADSTFATQVVVNEEIASRIEAIREVNTALGTKADKSDTYTKSQVDDALALKQDASTAFSGDYDDLTNKPDLSVYAESANLATVATSGSYNDLSNKPTIPVVPTNVSAFTNDAGYLTEHQSLDNYYTKTQVDTALSDKVSQTEFDTKEEVISTALNELDENKQDKLTAGANITIDANNVISSTGGTQQQADWNQSDSTAVDYIKNKPTIPDTSEFVTKTEYNPKEVAIAKALTQLNDTKADKTELPDVSTFATKTEVNTALSAKADKSDTYTKTQTDAAIQTAVGQIDLSDYVEKDDFDTKEEVISTALNNLAANKQDALTAGTGISIQNNVISATGGGGGTQQQADWNQTDTTAVDYIKNKPTIPSQFTDVDDIQKVNALPANPDSRTLYLIPVE